MAHKITSQVAWIHTGIVLQLLLQLLLEERSQRSVVWRCGGRGLLVLRLGRFIMNCEKKESDDKNKNDSAATSLGWCARWWLLPHQSTSQHWFFLSLRVPQCLRDTNQHKSNIKACIKKDHFFSTLAFFSCHGSSCLSAPTSTQHPQQRVIA